ncbi:MAG: ABC transporter ATP-binding protein [Dehalococcoidia bacterium]
MAIIKTKDLTKRFKDVLAVDDVSLEIEEGECFGLLGPNGAGKTTLIRMITAVSPPTNGEIWVQGKDLERSAREAKAIMGVVPQLDNLDPDLTVLQNLMTFARYFNVPKHEARRRSMELLGLFKLEDKRNSAIRELSGGMRRRLLIARGLVNNPRIIILDEPTIGLDPQARHLVWHKLTELHAQGVTRILCTHNMDEATVLCDRVAIMNEGRILDLDAPHKLVARHVGSDVWEIEVDSQERENLLAMLESRGLDFEDAGTHIYVFHVGREDILTGIVGDGHKLRQRPAHLEDVFFRLTGRSLIE